MDPRILRAVAILGLGPPLLAACRTPLQDYVVDHHYEPFEIPRDTDGVGTIIAFQDGLEVTIAREFECLGQLASFARGSPRRVALEDYQYEVERDDRLELRLLDVLQPGLRVEGAVDYQGVKSIQIRLLEPFEMLVSVKRIVDALPELDRTCRQLVLSEDHFVISQVLGARGIEYEFVDEHGTAVVLDAELLDRIGAGAELRRRFEGRSTLSVDFTILIGYRLLEARELPGVDESYRCDTVSPAAIRQLKTGGV